VDLVRNLERSQRFLQPRLANETAQTQEQGRLLASAQPGGAGADLGRVEFDILSGYNPLPAAGKSSPAKGQAKQDRPAAAKPAGDKPAAHKPAANKSGATLTAPSRPGGAR
jgi:type IV pilus assembly protein PilN